MPEFQSFRELRIVVQYYSELTHLIVPDLGKWYYILLSLGLHHEADAALFNLQLNDVNFGLSVSFNGAEWDLDTIKTFENCMVSDYRQIDIKTARKLRWYNKPIGLMIMAKHMNGHCGVRKVSASANSTTSDRAFYCQWPANRYNPDFNFTDWQRQNPNALQESIEISI